MNRNNLFEQTHAEKSGSLSRDEYKEQVLEIVGM
jgi:hypothetical protein